MVIEVTFDTTDVYISTTVSPVYVNVSFEAPSGGGGAVWGDITGTLSDQTDLQTALDGKFDDPTGTTSQYLRGDGSLATFPSLTGYVPYSGATGAVNLGAFDLLVQGLTIGKGNNSLVNNTALGHSTLLTITTGNFNTAVGYESLRNTTTGQYNTAIGQSSLFSNTTGGQNTALGLNALLSNTTGGSNVAVGLDTLQHITTGSSNTAIGYNAGSHITGGSTPNTTATNSVFIGRDSKAGADGQTNQIVIGQNAVGNGSNTATFGNTATTANYFTGSINGGSFVKTGGTSSQFLKADGTVDSSTYVGGSGATGQVAYWTGTSAQSGSNNLFWDAANGRLGIGTNAPSYTLEVRTNLAVPVEVGFRTANAFSNMAYGTMIANVEFSGWKGGGFGNENAAIQVYYNGDGTNRKGKMHLLVAESTNLGSSNITLSQSTTNNKITIIGTLGNNYNDTIASPSLTTTYAQHANTIINGDGGIPILSIDRLGVVQSVVFANGNFSVGGTTDNGERLQVQGTTLLNGNVSVSGSTTASSAIARGLNLTPTLVAAANNDVLVGLDVNPTFTNGAFTGVSNYAARIQGTLFISKNHNASTSLTIENTTSGTSAQSVVSLFANTGFTQIGKRSTTTIASKIIAASDTFIYNSTDNGDIAILNDFSTGNIKFAAGGSSTAQMTLHNTGNLLLGSTSNTGERLQVTGTMKVTGEVTIPITTATTTGVSITNSNTAGNPTFNITNNNSTLGFFRCYGTTFGTGSYTELSDIVGFGSTKSIKIFTDAAATSGGTNSIQFMAGGYNNDQERARIGTYGMLIGTKTSTASSILTLASTNQGFLPPRMTTTQKNAISSPAAGLVVYDTTLNKLCVYTTAWETITSA